MGRMVSLALALLLMGGASCSRDRAAAQATASPAPVQSTPALVAKPESLPRVEHVVFVLFENESPDGLPRDGFFARVAREGAYLEDCHGVARPSQPNYLALTSGDTHGASNDPVTLAVPHVGTRLEDKGLSWRCYAESYPGGCFLDATAPQYARKHVPFLSYADVTSDSIRCAKQVMPLERFFDDVRAGTLPTYSFLSPNLDNDGHDKGPKHADAWATRVLGPLLSDPSFSKGTLLVVVFDEGHHGDAANRIYCAFWGEVVKPGARVLARVDHYGLLRTVEDLFGLPTLTAHDAAARRVSGIWRGTP